MTRKLILLVTAFALLFQLVFGGDPAAENRDAVLRVLKNMATRAQEHYHLDVSQGGGHGAFNGSTGGVAIWAIGFLTSRPSTSVGSFVVATVSGNAIVIIGTGKVIGDDGCCPIEVDVTVFSDSIAITFIN
ncbi:MAG: hypothetical protein ACKVRP_05570 [Bacteroidota bacterium]